MKYYYTLQDIIKKNYLTKLIKHTKSSLPTYLLSPFLPNPSISIFRGFLADSKQLEADNQGIELQLEPLSDYISFLSIFFFRILCFLFFTFWGWISSINFFRLVQGWIRQKWHIQPSKAASIATVLAAPCADLCLVSCKSTKCATSKEHLLWTCAKLCTSLQGLSLIFQFFFFFNFQPNF